MVLCKSLRDTSSRLAELGWLHNKVRKYTDARSLDRAFGLVGQVCVCVGHVYLLMSVLAHSPPLMLTFVFLRFTSPPTPSELLCVAPPGAEGVLQAPLCPPLTGEQMHVYNEGTRNGKSW